MRQFFINHHQSHYQLWSQGCWSADHLKSSLHISGLKARDIFIHVCVLIKKTWQDSILKPQTMPSKIKTHIEQTHGHWRNPSLLPLASIQETLWQWCCVIIAVVASIAMELSLPIGADGCWPYRMILLLFDRELV